MLVEYYLSVFVQINWRKEYCLFNRIVTKCFSSWITCMVIPFHDLINFCTRYDKNQEAFCENVRLCVKTSQERVYDPAPVEDLHYISFEPYDNEVHGPIRDAIFKVKVCYFFPSISFLPKSILSFVQWLANCICCFLSC